MKSCRECGHTVSEQAIHCPGCGAPYPDKINGMDGDLSTNQKALSLAGPWYIYPLNTVPTGYLYQQKALSLLANSGSV